MLRRKEGIRTLELWPVPSGFAAWIAQRNGCSPRRVPVYPGLPRLRDLERHWWPWQTCGWVVMRPASRPFHNHGRQADLAVLIRRRHFSP